MADKKKPTNWRSVKPGNIVSFRYKSKSGKVRVQTILVLNPRLPVTLKDGTKKRYHKGQINREIIVLYIPTFCFN